MTRKNLFLIVMAFIVGVTVWIFFVNKSLQKTQEVLVEEVRTPRRSVSSVPSPAPVESPLKKQLQAEIQDLQVQIREQQQSLETQKKSLADLKTKQAQNSGAAISTQISERTGEIQGFADELRSYQYAEQDINRRAAEALREQSSAAQVARDQIDENIRAQQNLIRQTQEEITYWEGNYFYLNEREARLQDLRALLDAQNQQLQGMRDQRLAISAQVLENTRSVQGQKEQELSDLSESRNALLDEISSLREEIQRLQGTQYQVRTSQMSLRSQVNQLQTEIDRRTQQLQSLETSRQEKERQLKLLQ